MLREITWEEFLEWHAYDQLDPFGEERQDIRVASQNQILVNLHRKKDTDPLPLSEFVLPFGDFVKPPTKQQSWQSMKAQMMDFSAAMGTPAPPEVQIAMAAPAVSDSPRPVSGPPLSEPPPGPPPGAFFLGMDDPSDG